MQQVPGSLYTFLKENDLIAKPEGGKIRRQILEGAESVEAMACVKYEAIIGSFYMWPLLHALKYRPPDGSDPHILDMCPVYQQAYKSVMEAAAKPELVAANQLILLPDFPHFYPSQEQKESEKPYNS